LRSLRKAGTDADVMVNECRVNGVSDGVESLVSARLRLTNNSVAAVRIFDIKLGEEFEDEGDKGCIHLDPDGWMASIKSVYIPKHNNLY
jgi:hypothetical protein